MDLDDNQKRLIAGASAVSGHVWTHSSNEIRANELVSAGLLIRISRLQYKLTEEGKELRCHLRSIRHDSV